ncbi:ribokinase [Reinekea sp.]|uniref:ribokinase n=1 Tax=Reinekea sp. TaxID=1970455 RepID=UPI002A8242F2|nr:ribokinase [Reinekea sp.]
MTKLVVLGSTNVDHVLNVNHFPSPGETINSDSYQVMSGGKGGNQAVAARRMGAQVAFISCIGSDALGSQMLKQYQESGIDTECILQVAGQNTGTALIFVDQTGENCIGISAQANGHLSAERVYQCRDQIAQADALLLQLETPIDGVIAAAKIASESATLVVLNPAPAQSLPNELLSLVSLITPNETEVAALTGITVHDDTSAAQACEVLHAIGIAQVIITLGARGAWFSDKGQGNLISGFKVTAVDTTAAGDCFNGALLAGIQQTGSVSASINFAQAAAALTVTQPGAQESIPSQEQVEAFLLTNM